MARAKAKEVDTSKSVALFRKEQIVASKRYENDVDIVNALLQDEKEYALVEVDELIERFKKGKVK